MTHTPEEIEALVKAAQEALNTSGYNPVTQTNEKAQLEKALVPFLPKEEWEYPLPETRPEGFERILLDRGLPLYHLALDDLWNALRQLTRVKKKPEGREWWIRGGAVFDHKDNAEKATQLSSPIIPVREVLK
jgi:hypothetical protein